MQFGSMGADYSRLIQIVSNRPQVVPDIGAAKNDAHVMTVLETVQYYPRRTNVAHLTFLFTAIKGPDRKYVVHRSSINRPLKSPNLWEQYGIIHET